jgi:hypothetical protein
MLTLTVCTRDKSGQSGQARKEWPPSVPTRCPGFRLLGTKPYFQLVNGRNSSDPTFGAFQVDFGPNFEPFMSLAGRTPR